MHKIFRVCLREYKAIVQTKMFIAILVLAPVMMSGGLIAGHLAERNIDTKDKKLAVIDRSGVLADALVKAAADRNASELVDRESGKKVRPAYFIEIVEPNDGDPVRQRLELSDLVRNKSLHAFLEIGNDVVHPTKMYIEGIKYYGQNAAMDDMRRWVEWPINNRLRQIRLQDAGIDESTVKDLFVWIGAGGMGLVTVDEETGEMTDARKVNEIEVVLIPFGLCMFMYFMLMLVSQSLLASVVEEKTQRIAEVLLGSVGPFEFMMGKLLGGVGVALTAMALYLAGGIAIVSHLGYGSFVPYSLLPWFFVYMILAIFMYGAVAAALGSLPNDMKDAQSLGFPAMLPLILSLFIVISIMRNPSSAYATWISLVPVFTPMVMVFRIASPELVPLWQQIAGITSVIGFALFSVWIGGRVFRIGLMVHGKMPKLRNVIRWAIRG